MTNATAERSTARNADIDTMSLACQSTRSSTVGSTSSTHEKIHRPAISMTAAALWETSPYRLRQERIGDSAHAATNPAKAMKMSHWFRYRRCFSLSERGRK